jgi:hypothetical protein
MPHVIYTSFLRKHAKKKGFLRHLVRNNHLTNFFFAYGLFKKNYSKEGNVMESTPQKNCAERKKRQFKKNKRTQLFFTVDSSFFTYTFPDRWNLVPCIMKD